MNVFIVTAGSRGDVQPFIVLGKGLKTKGHTVTLCTCSRFEPFIVEYGLNYGYMNDNLLKLLDSEAGREVIENSGNFLGLIKTTLTLFQKAKALNREMFQDTWNAAQAAQPDILIFHPKILVGSHIAEKLSIPAIMATLVPAIAPTAESVAIGFPSLKLGSWYNKFSYWILHQGYRMYNEVINEFRQNVLGLEKLSKSISPIQMPNGQLLPILHGYSELVSPRPSD
ncbi:MAG: glycosyltransferase, partial [Pleurocapsa sp.]